MSRNSFGRVVRSSRPADLTFESALDERFSLTLDAWRSRLAGWNERGPAAPAPVRIVWRNHHLIERVAA
jgi:hypothetical protein